MRDIEKTRKTVFKLRSFFIFKRSYKLFKMDITKKGQILLFPPPQLTEYFVLLSPSEEIKKETTKLKKKLYKMIGRETENSKSVAHISLFKTKWEHDKHVLERVRKSMADQKEFAVSINGTNSYNHGTKAKTLYLKVENPKPIQSLYEAFKEEFKIKNGFNPHLTIEQNIPLADFEKIQDNLDVFNYKNEWICDNVTILKKKENGSYKVVGQIQLQG